MKMLEKLLDCYCIAHPYIRYSDMCTNFAMSAFNTWPVTWLDPFREWKSSEWSLYSGSLSCSPGLTTASWSTIPVCLDQILSSAIKIGNRKAYCTNITFRINLPCRACSNDFLGFRKSACQLGQVRTKMCLIESPFLEKKKLARASEQVLMSLPGCETMQF